MDEKTTQALFHLIRSDRAVLNVALALALTLFGEAVNREPSHSPITPITCHWSVLRKRGYRQTENQPKQNRNPNNHSPRHGLFSLLLRTILGFICSSLLPPRFIVPRWR